MQLQKFFHEYSQGSLTVKVLFHKCFVLYGIQWLLILLILFKQWIIREEVGSCLKLGTSKNLF